MNTTFDFAPLWRSGIGFDHVFNLLEQAGKSDQADNYPPYDIEKTGEDVYRLTMALAGWMPDEIAVVTEPNVLIVSGQKADSENHEYLHRGIPAGPFERRFNLADYVEVSEATLQLGLLAIDLVRKVPEEKKPRRVGIASGNGPKTIEHQQAA
jgi:molecular chaperone IbpA